MEDHLKETLFILGQGNGKYSELEILHHYLHSNASTYCLDKFLQETWNSHKTSPVTENLRDTIWKRIEGELKKEEMDNS